MKKYFVMYMAKSADFKKIMATMGKMTPAQQKESMKEWATWMKGKSVVDGGAPLGRTKRVTAKKVSDAKNEVGGYSIIRSEFPRRGGKKDAE